MKAMSWLAVLAGGLLGFPALAVAHGDDHVTAASFVGPLLGLLVFVVVLGVGRTIVRRWMGAWAHGLP